VRGVLGFVGVVRTFFSLDRTRVFGAFAGLAGILLILLGPATAAAFDYAKYQPVDLDAMAARQAPSGSGVDVYPVKNYRFDVTLVTQSAPCPDNFLKWAMLTSGIPKDWIDRVPINHCIQVKSAKGKLMSMFIQDALTDSLAKEVPQGGKMTLFVMLVYYGQSGPGIVINEFNTLEQLASQTQTKDCGCGKDVHSGLDFSAPEGTPVQVVDDGAVVRIEQDETADVDVPTAGKCGRYVVVKHTFPNGRTAYSRYAQLGRLVGNNGKSLTLGQKLKAKDTIGEVGSQGRFHFEIRPVDSAGIDQTPKWAQLYGADPTMEWSRYAAVDPQNFDDDVFGGKKDKATAGKK
jgi:Peptidase family M23